LLVSYSIDTSGPAYADESLLSSGSMRRWNLRLAKQTYDSGLEEPCHSVQRKQEDW